jgi:hypothetical protein
MYNNFALNELNLHSCWLRTHDMYMHCATVGTERNYSIIQ